MSTLQGAQVLVTGGAGTIGSTIVDHLLDAGAGRIDVLDNLVRGRRANLDPAIASGRVHLIEGDLRDRDLVHDLSRGKDIVFHQAAIRITQCAEEPRLALEVLVDGTFNVLEAASAQRVGKLVAASSASVYGMAETFPTPERHHHYNNDTFYGAAKSFNEAMARSFRAMSGLDYVLLRYFNVYGPADGRPWPLHRGAGALDGAHRGRPAAADLRRRPADHGLRPHEGRGPRQYPGRGQRSGRRRVQRRQRRRDQPAGTGRGAVAGHGFGAARRARPRAGRQRRRPAPGGYGGRPPRPGVHGRNRPRRRAAGTGGLVAAAARRNCGRQGGGAR